MPFRPPAVVLLREQLVVIRDRCSFGQRKKVFLMLVEIWAWVAHGQRTKCLSGPLSPGEAVADVMVTSVVFWGDWSGRRDPVAEWKIRRGTFLQDVTEWDLLGLPWLFKRGHRQEESRLLERRRPGAQ